MISLSEYLSLAALLFGIGIAGIILHFHAAQLASLCYRSREH